MSQKQENVNVELTDADLDSVAGGAINITAPIGNTVGTTTTTTTSTSDTQTNPLSTDDKSKTTFHY